MNSKEIKNKIETLQKKIEILQKKIQDSRNQNYKLEDDLSKSLKKKYENDPILKSWDFHIHLYFCTIHEKNGKSSVDISFHENTKSYVFHCVSNYLDYQEVIYTLTQINTEFNSEYEKNAIDFKSEYGELEILYDELEILKKQKTEQIKKEIWEIGLIRKFTNYFYRNSRTVKLLKINKKTVKLELDGNKVLKVPKSQYEKGTNSYEII